MFYQKLIQAWMAISVHSFATKLTPLCSSSFSYLILFVFAAMLYLLVHIETFLWTSSRYEKRMPNQEAISGVEPSHVFLWANAPLNA